MSGLNDHTFRSLFDRLYIERTKLQKIKLKEVREKELFDSKQWTIPKLLPKTERNLKRKSTDEDTVPPHSETTVKKGKFCEFAELVKDEALDKLASENKQLVDENTKLKQDNRELEEKILKLRKENHKLRQQKLNGNCSRLQQALKRKSEQVKLWRDKYSSVRNHKGIIKKLKEPVTKSKESIQKIQKAKKQQTRRHRNKLLELNLDHMYKKSELEVKINQITSEKNEQIQHLENSLNTLKLDDLENRETFNTKYDGKSFHPKIREASYMLQNLGMSQKNASKAIELSLNILSNVELCGSLPSYTSQNTFQTLKDKTNTTLKFDGTTKRNGHLVELEVATPQETLLLGIRRQSGASALEYANTIRHCIADIEDSDQPATGDIPPINLLQNVSNTMTDRCPTNSAIENILDSDRDVKLNRFRCAMHPLDSMAKECEQVVFNFEQSNKICDTKNPKLKYPFLNRGESNTKALVRTTAKLFYDLQYNCDKELVSYLQSRDVANNSVVYHRFVGNRFHIYFLDSALLYHYKDSISSFFCSAYPPNNDVQMSVYNAIQLKTMNVTLRALGIVGKIMTGPWMRLIGMNHDCNILEFNKYIYEAEKKLTSWSTNATPLLSQKTSIFSTVPVKEDKVLVGLLKSTSYDNATKCLLQELCQAILNVIHRQMSDQLPGGLHWNSTRKL